MIYYMKHVKKVIQNFINAKINVYFIPVFVIFRKLLISAFVITKISLNNKFV